MKNIERCALDLRREAGLVRRLLARDDLSDNYRCTVLATSARRLRELTAWADLFLGSWWSPVPRRSLESARDEGSDAADLAESVARLLSEDGE